MLLSVFTRQTADFKFLEERACRRCNCPKWVGGQFIQAHFYQNETAGVPTDGPAQR